MGKAPINAQFQPWHDQALLWLRVKLFRVKLIREIILVQN